MRIHITETYDLLITPTMIGRVVSKNKAKEIAQKVAEEYFK